MTRRYVELWRRVRSGLWSPRLTQFALGQSIFLRRSIDGDAACKDRQTNPLDCSSQRVKHLIHVKPELVTGLSITDASLAFRIRDVWVNLPKLRAVKSARSEHMLTALGIEKLAFKLAAFVHFR